MDKLLDAIKLLFDIISFFMKQNCPIFDGFTYGEVFFGFFELFVMFYIFFKLME